MRIRIFDVLAMLNTGLIVRELRILKVRIILQFFGLIVYNCSIQRGLSLIRIFCLQMFDLLLGAIDIDAHLFSLSVLVSKEKSYFIFDIFVDFFGLGVVFSSAVMVLFDSAFEH